MVALNVFESSAFNTMSLTAAVNKLPFIPNWLRSTGLFSPKPVRNTTVFIEEKDGRVTLVPSAARGSRGNEHRRAQRKGRDLRLIHLPEEGVIRADDVQDVRAFGSESELEAVASVVNEELAAMIQNLEATMEYHRAGAIQGSIKDADMTTELLNLFTEFGITETVIDFDLAGAGVPATKSTEVIRTMEDALGGTPFQGIVGICGDTFWDEFVVHADVKEAYARWRDGHFLRTQAMGGGHFVGPGGSQGFECFGITWVNYRAAIGGNKFIPVGDCRFVPMGVPDLFQHVMGPADYMETVNTMGQEFYAKQELMRMGKGVDLEAQANVLMIANRPKALIRGTNT